MKYSNDSLRKSLLLSLTISVISILLLSCCVYFIGLRFETGKLKAFLTCLVLVFFYKIYIGDTIFFILKATYKTLRYFLPYDGNINAFSIGIHDRKKYLIRQISVFKYQLQLGSSFFKRNLNLTIKYKDILNDLRLYGCYLVVLIVLVTKTRDPLIYYNTRTIKDVLRNPKFSNFGTSTILTSDDLYNFINETIVNGLIDGKSYNGNAFEESGWTNLQIAKVLGVVRLRQIRFKNLKKKYGYDSNYGPGWSEAPLLPFKDKFWRIFKPWEYQSKEEIGSIDKSGKLHNIAGGGYVTLLGRNLVNCQRVLKFLQSNNWIDHHTAVIVIEFVLYNVDADIFTLVTIAAEQTGFDSFEVTDKIESLKILFNIDNLEFSVILTFLLYFFIFTKVFADVVLKIWYSDSMREYTSNFWNYVDITIIILNLAIALGVWIREVYAKSLLLKIETSRKNEFVPFNKAANIDEICTVLVAFLIALTTLRLWKILQFAKVFRVLTTTLYNAKWELASTTFFVSIFLTGVGLGLNIINGSNSIMFVQFIKSITTLISLSFGFGTVATSSELNISGNVVGLVFYVMLVVVVTIFLLNMFITVVCLHFSKEKELDVENTGNEEHYSFWKFLLMEFEDYFPMNMIRKQNIARRKLRDVKINERIERLELISKILCLQTELFQENTNIQADKSSKTIEVIVEKI